MARVDALMRGCADALQVSPAATIPIIYLKRRQACVRSAKCVLAPLKGELS